MTLTMLSVFDYIFLRVHQFFKERGDNIPDTKGTSVLSLIQFLTVFNLMDLARLVGDFAFPSKFGFFLPLIIIIGAVNWFRYQRDVDVQPKLEIRWKEEDQGKRVMRGWLISVYIIVSFLIPVMLGYLEHNLKAI
jgi:hypothetical protein